MLNSPIVHVQDDFFDSGEKTREKILSLEFVDVKSPVDAVTYPDICMNLSEEVAAEFVSKVESLLKATVVPKFLFARAMIKGRPVPHKVHSDFNMGRYSAHVYLSHAWPEGSGTSFFKHDTQGYLGVSTTDWKQIDHNSMSAWSKYASCQAKFNRILIHDSQSWHMAEPQDAWGDSPKNGRLVLTMFFDLEVDDAGR